MLEVYVDLSCQYEMHDHIQPTHVQRIVILDNSGTERHIMEIVLLDKNSIWVHKLKYKKFDLSIHL